MKKKWITIAGAVMLTMAMTACGSQGNTQSASSGNDITEAEAKEIALKDAGLTSDEAKNIYVHLDTDDGVREYEVEFYAGNQEYDYNIDATDGTIRSKDTDAENVDIGKTQESTANTTGSEAAISEEDAKKTALAKVEGATDADIRIHLETDDGVKQYSGSIVYNEKQYEFSINAADGTIMEWEEDSIYDD